MKFRSILQSFDKPLFYLLVVFVLCSIDFRSILQNGGQPLIRSVFVLMPIDFISLLQNCNRLLFHMLVAFVLISSGLEHIFQNTGKNTLLLVGCFCFDSQSFYMHSPIMLQSTSGSYPTHPNSFQTFFSFLTRFYLSQTSVFEAGPKAPERIKQGRTRYKACKGDSLAARFACGSLALRTGKRTLDRCPTVLQTSQGHASFN